MLPVSDAVLGAAGYLADAVTGALFGVLRWRTHPWIVVIFGVAVGPLMAAAAFLAIFAITRGLRWFNLLVGAWLVTVPWLLDFPTDATVSSVVCGVAALVLAPVGSVDQSRYGGGWRALWETNRLPAAQSE